MSNSKFKCLLCNLTFSSQERLNKHKFSKTHLENINKIEIEPLVNEKDNSITSYDLDPYLNKEDLNKLQNMNIGEGCQITFKNENIIKCNFNFTKEKNKNKNILNNQIKENINFTTKIEEKETNNNAKETNNNNVKETNNNAKETKKEILKTKINKEILKTSKQIQILTYLKQNQDHPQIFNKWFQILQKVSNENLRGLIKFLVDDLNIKIEIKQKLLTVVKKYKQILVLKKQKGEKTFNNNNIIDIISLLVC